MSGDRELVSGQKASAAVAQQAVAGSGVPAAPVPLPAQGGVAGALVVGHAADRAETEADKMADVALSRLRRLDSGGAGAETAHRLRAERAHTFGAPSLPARAPLRRLVADGSDPNLSATYNQMRTDSPTWRALDKQMASPPHEIRLVDSSLVGDPPYDVDYASDTHTIQVPYHVGPFGPARQDHEIKEDLLWEMHNAANRGPLGRAHAMPGAFDLPHNATQEEKKQHPYHVAAKALAIEWTEWIRTVDFQERVNNINANEQPDAGPVGQGYAAQFAEPGEGWFLFENYLEDQIASEHTAHYDPAAAPPAQEWVGHFLLKLVHKASLTVTVEQLRGFRSGKTRSSKQVSNNPFVSKALVTEATRTL